ncbi:MAG: nickel-dependent hydrogenase large subunit [Candidatus Aenigmatarchaeota archaeon]
MPKRTVIPFGPQHPVLPEPIHLDLVLEDERVVDALPSIGYIHRGLEKLVEKREFSEYVYVIERTCGICSYIHGLSYSQAIEKIMGLEVPERALYLRTIGSEYSRMHSHLLILGCRADGMGFESLFMGLWKVREKILDRMEKSLGGRVIQGTCKVGGVRKDIPGESLDEIVTEMAGIEKDIKELTGTLLRDGSVKHRLKGVGMMGKSDAYYLGAVGPTARGSGVMNDMRKLGYAAYGKIKFNPVLETGGDCYARTAVRVNELFRSADIIRQCAKKIPDGPIDVKFTGYPKGEYFSRVEQPRGEAVHYAKGNGTPFLQRFRVRTPTFANIPPLIHMLKGCELADVPVIILSIDPCISCTER